MGKIFNKNGKKKKKFKKNAYENIKEVSIVDIRDVDIPDNILDDFDEYAKTFKEQYITGRPTKYKPEFCTHILKEFAKGKTLNTVAVQMGLNLVRFHHWSKKYPEFRKALKIGLALSKCWWEEMGRLNIGNKNFHATLYMMIMSNRFGWISSKHNINTKAHIQSKHIEKKQIEVKINNEKAAEVLKILQDAGGIEKTIGLLNASVDEVIEGEKDE